MSKIADIKAAALRTEMLDNKRMEERQDF
ncbi:hypothetical protein LINPERPRIM_LOCUS37852 [Linum perenne]